MWKFLAVSLTSVFIAICVFADDPNVKHWGQLALDHRDDLIANYKHDRTLYNSVGISCATGLVWLVIFIVMRKFGISTHNSTTVPVPEKDESVIAKEPSKEPSKENVLLDKARARVLYSELEIMLGTLQGRKRWIPDEIIRARDEVNVSRSNEEVAKNQLESATKRRERAEEKHKELLEEERANNDSIMSIISEMEKLKTTI